MQTEKRVLRVQHSPLLRAFGLQNNNHRTSIACRWQIRAQTIPAVRSPEGVSHA